MPRSKWARARYRAAPFFVAACALIVARRGADINPTAPNASAALAEALTRRGLACTADDVTWLTEPAGVAGALTGGARALVRANQRYAASSGLAPEPSDLYLVPVRLSPEGVVLEAGDGWNITRTIGVDEGRPVLSTNGALAAYATSIDRIPTAVHTIELAGRPVSSYPDFTRLQRWQLALSNLQQTGQMAGVVHTAFTLDPSPNGVTVEFSASGELVVHADLHRIAIDAARGEVTAGHEFVRVVPELKSRPGNLVTWAVDRTRAMPWFGEERMQWVKAIAFTGLDWCHEVRAKLLGDRSAKEVVEDLGGVNSGKGNVSYTDPELGFPPAPLTPILSPPLPLEGQWISLDKDPFITQTPGAPSAFVTSFLRSDKSRPSARIYVTMWDPRQIALHMEAGTVEPVSATGEAGPGVIPRTPEVIRHVVAGFNGGFQAAHGEYGMQANGVLYLPPKPYAATVLELKDGTTGFGAWPASSTVPDEVLSYRQNMTALVQESRFNPWGRTWWGGTPKGWADNIHTTRSGVCLTKENFVGYFWSADSSAEALAAAMLQSRCAFGIHLDMNPGLAGFEFYNVQSSGSWTPLGRPLQSDWEYEGTFRDLPDFHYRARRMIKGMRHMNFPQYIHRDGRDFFYLTQRPVLPGANIAPAIAPPEPSEGVWRVKGLPQHGFPYALAIAELRPDTSAPDVHVRVLRVDARVVAVASETPSNAAPVVVSFSSSSPIRVRTGELGMWFDRGIFSIARGAPSESARLVAGGWPLASAPSARAAMGVHDEDGMLTWVELDPSAIPSSRNAAMMDALLERLGCSARLLVGGSARAYLGEELDIRGQKTAIPPTDLTQFVRSAAPSARPYFESTPIVSPNTWQPLQSQRVRYFKKPRPAAKRADSDPLAAPDAVEPAPPTEAPTPQLDRDVAPTEPERDNPPPP